MGVRTSKNVVKTRNRNFIDARQAENIATKLGETNTVKNTSSIKNVEQDTESSKPSTSQKTSLNVPGGSILHSLSESDDEDLPQDSPLHFYSNIGPDIRANISGPLHYMEPLHNVGMYDHASNSTSHSYSNRGPNTFENITEPGTLDALFHLARNREAMIRGSMDEFCSYPMLSVRQKVYHAPPIKEKKISTVNDILKVNSMVEQLLPHLEKDTISSISNTICEFAGIAVLESDEHSRSIVFAYEKKKLSISVDTIVQLVENKCLREVDLMLPENELPDIEGKSRKEILDILASGGGEDHENLIECLTRLDIEHIVSPYTKNIFTDLSISGGGPCEYQMFSAVPSEPLPSASRTQEYQRKIANSIQKSVRDRKVEIGVIDSGCSHSLYQQLNARGTVVMHNRMISAVNVSSRAIETDYQDCFVNGADTGHGTGVVEIIGNCVLPGTKIYVANVGYPFYPSNVECAMMELFSRNVDVLNCSVFVRKSKHLATTLKAIKSAVTGVVVVAAVGNRPYNDSIDNGFNDGSTILVGSHNDQNSISAFSIAQCKANICSRGEGVYIGSVEPNFRNGTSFATANVTAAVANVLSFISSVAVDLIRNLQSSAQDLKCGCIQHEGKEVNLKFQPESFVYACL